jgi:catechol 2,3-dioxygenase-like lactoylglutathione lyase family enzyme
MIPGDTGFMASSERLRSRKIMAFAGVRDPERAKAFYRDTLGLQLVNEQLPFALVFDAQGIMLRVSIVEQVAAAPYTVLGWEVPDIAAAVKELGDAGVGFERFEGMKQDNLGVWKSPGGARVAWFKDPDGNLLSLTQL